MIAAERKPAAMKVEGEDKAFNHCSPAIMAVRHSLHNSEEQYRVLFERNPHPMWVYEESTLAFLAVNDAAIRHYGYTREEFLRMTIKDIRPPEDVPSLLEAFEKSPRGLEEVSTWRHCKKDGTVILVDITSNSITFDGRRARLVLADDIAERLATEAALRETEQRAIIQYEHLLDRLESLAQTFGTARNLPIIFRALCDFANVSTPCNSVFISLYNHERNERTAAYACREGEEIGLPALPITESPHSRAVTTGKVVITDDFQAAIEKQSGVDMVFDKNLRLPRSSLAVPMNFMGRTLGAIEMLSFDLAAFNQGHVTAMRMAANLAAAAIENVRLLERELQRADQGAESDKMRSLGQLAAGVAHDFNNLLAAILGRTQLLLRIVTDEKQRRHLAVIETASLDAAETVRRIQTFSRRSPAKQLSGISVSRLIADAIQLTRTRWEDDARARGLRYDIRFTPVFEGSDGVSVNPSEVREVFVNLILNSLDAMPLGGRIDICQSRDDGFVVIEVTDTGVGVPSALLDRIFEPFFTTKGPQGSGLGLAVSYGIIHRHAGTIEVKSRVGQGTTFTIRLPYMTEAPALASMARNIALTKRRVLVVDDEEVVREVLVEMLHELKQEVVGVKSAAEALDSLATNTFDLMITDLSMPDMDGITLAAEAQRCAPDILIALATGYGQTIPGGIPDPALINTILNKPFLMADLEASLLALDAANVQKTR